MRIKGCTSSMFFFVTLLAGVSALSASAHNVAVEEPDTILSLDEVSVTAIKQSADMRRLPVASTGVGALRLHCKQ